MGDARTTSASRYVYAPTSPRVLQTVVDRTHDRAPDMHVKFAAARGGALFKGDRVMHD